MTKQDIENKILLISILLDYLPIALHLQNEWSHTDYWH